MRCSYLSVGIIALVLMLVGPAGAQVRDEAGFFTPNAVERANQLISQFRSQTKHDLVVETIPAVPASQRAQLQQMGNERFFSEYTRQFAQQDRTNGVFVLICKDPSYLKVAVGDNTQRSGLFTTANRDRLASTLLSSFRAKNYDQGLMDAVSYVQQTVTSNAQVGKPTATPSARTGTGGPVAAPQPSSRSGGHGMLFWIVVLGGGFFVLMALIRRVAARMGGLTSPTAYNQNVPPPLPGERTGYGSNPTAYPGYGTGGGGGFGPGILGGLLGGAAGGWLYDRVAHRNDPGAGYPGQTPVRPGANASPDPYEAPADRDFSVSSGGDFSDGGGGAGGGDFGGGGSSDDNGGGSF